MLTRDLPSYRRQGSGKRMVRNFLLIIIMVFLFVLVLEGLFLKTYRVLSESMAPTVSSGAMVFVSPLLFGKKSFFSGETWLDFTVPGRGDVIMIEPPWSAPSNFIQRIGRHVGSFFSLGSWQARFAGPDEKSWETSLVLRRVIAVPGDQIYGNDGLFYVKPKGASSFVNEFTISSHQYRLKRAKVSLRDQNLAFSAEMPLMALGPGDFFVASDNREFGLDSRHWGAVKPETFRGLVILRYWPFNQIGWVR